MPAFIYAHTIVPVGRYIFGPCGEQPDHPFFTSLRREPGRVFARRTAWLEGRAFTKEFGTLSGPIDVWLGARDRLVDLGRQQRLFKRLEQKAKYTLRILPDEGHVVLPLHAVSQLAAEAAQQLRKA